MSKYYTLRYTDLQGVDRAPIGTGTIGSPYVNGKISAIKEHRKLTASSLKEAKEAIESALEGNTIRMVDNRVEHPKSEDSISDVMVNFADYGFKMEGPFDDNEIAKDLRSLTKKAIDEDEFDVALRLIDILQDLE